MFLVRMKISEIVSDAHRCRLLGFLVVCLDHVAKECQFAWVAGSGSIEPELALFRIVDPSQIIF